MRRPVVIAALAMLVAIGVALPRAGETRAAAPEPKVVVIVGATHGTTPKYRKWADVIAAEAKKYTSNVVKVYSPYATWSAVKAALQGANVVVYLGHGNGFPNPYRSVLWPYSVDGFGLNAVAGQGDSNTKYYGEYYVAKEVKLAPDAVVILNHLCYASGNPEPGNPEATLSVAHQRIDNYGAGFIKAGAAAVVAEGKSGGEWWIRTLFTTRQTMEQAFRSNPAENGHVVTFPSTRTPGATAFSDPDTTSGGYYRSMVGRPDLNTADVTGAPASDTGSDPDDFVVPGSASVGTGGATIYGGADLAAESTTLPAGTKLRVLASAPDSDAGRVFNVRTMDGATTGYAAEADLVPRDSLGPLVWGWPDQQTFSPNGDGVDDVLQVRANFSEAVGWTVKLRDDAGKVIWSKAGSGTTLAADWLGLAAGAGAPEGVYDLSVSGVDEWGNSPVERASQVLLDRHPGDRLAGADRYATAAAISKATFAPGVELVYVATGANFPDALAGAAAAGKTGSPVLLVGANAIPSATATELSRLKPGRIVVLGASGVVFDSVVAALKGYTTGTVTRLAGLDRFATSAAISARIVRSWGRRRLRRDGRQLPGCPSRGGGRGDERCAGPPRRYRLHPDGDRVGAQPTQARPDRRPRRRRRGLAGRADRSAGVHRRDRDPPGRRRPLRHRGGDQQGDLRPRRRARLRRDRGELPGRARWCCGRRQDGLARPPRRGERDPVGDRDGAQPTQAGPHRRPRRFGRRVGHGQIGPGRVRRLVTRSGRTRPHQT